MTARWMLCITALGAALAGACDKGKSPAAGGTQEAATAPAPATEAQPEPPPSTEPPPAGGTAEPAQPTASDGPADAGTAGGAEPAAGGAEPAAGGEPSGAPPGARGKCGGVAGFHCKKNEKCRYGTSAFTAPHPDAMGACVPGTYCDAVADCDGLMHVMTVGKWACEKSRCAWKSEGGSAPQ
jgi:hypothetical protein